jgi:hypothetical protein
MDLKQDIYISGVQIKSWILCDQSMGALDISGRKNKYEENQALNNTTNCNTVG